MDEMYGLHSTGGDDYTERALISDPDNLIIPAVDYLQYQHHYGSMFPSAGDRGNIPVFGSDDLDFQCSAGASESVSINAHNNHDKDHAAPASTVIKAKIASHPSYPKLIDAYVDCQKVGAPPEIASLLDEIRREKELCKYQNSVPICLGTDPELDEFMETYYDVLVKYKWDLSRSFDEATSFLHKIETQLGNLCKDDGSVSSDDELSGGETEEKPDGELKDRLLREYGSHIGSLKLEFSKKKKKGKLPKESRQTLLQWWNVHYKWPYPTEEDKIWLAEATGLDQKQISNWFINQRKRHWKPSEYMQLAIINNLSGPLISLPTPTTHYF